MTSTIPVLPAVFKGPPVESLFGGMIPVILHDDGSFDFLTGLVVEPNETIEAAIGRGLRPGDQLMAYHPSLSVAAFKNELLKAQIK